MTKANWCQILGITPPNLEAVASHPDANAFTLLLVALLERGDAMTLAEVAQRFDEVGIAERERALVSLKRCRPARPPVYRDGDQYRLDPHDRELELWMLRLGLRPPQVARPPAGVAAATPRPAPEIALTASELDEGWKDAYLDSWSAQRLAVAVLDAHGAPLLPAEVVAAVTARTRSHRLTPDTSSFNRRASAVHVLPDGRWAIAADAHAIVRQAREAVRECVAQKRRSAATRPDFARYDQVRQEAEQRRAVRAAELAKLTRALLVAFPPARPQAVALLDVSERAITTFVGDELAGLPKRLEAYDVLGAMGVHPLLRAIGVDPDEHRLAELGPPQKSKKLNQSGRTLKITTAMLIQGSCGISSPLGDDTKLAEYLATGDLTRLRRRLEANVKSLYALYEYGRLHGSVRLRWGFLDELISAPWAHPDEGRIYALKRAALAMNVPLEVVLGSAPGWAEPWSRVSQVWAKQDERGWRTWLVDEQGAPIDDADIQRARLPTDGH